jgi:phosphatidate cytidylyltransferase
MGDDDRDDRYLDRDAAWDREDREDPSVAAAEDAAPATSRWMEPATDSVRIVGAETARDVVSAERRERDNPADEIDLVEPIDRVGHGAAAADDRRVGYPADGPTWSASEPEPAAPEPPVEMPHWSEPPTAEMAALGSEPEPDADPELGAWAAFTGSQPRLRLEESDWADPDWELIDDDAAEAPPVAAEPFATDYDDDEFAAAVSRRRGGSRRPATPPPPPSRPRREAEAPPPAARDLPTALATAGIVAVVALICFEVGTFATALLTSVVVGLASLELTNGMRAGGLRPAVPITLISCATLPLAAREYGEAAILVFLFIVVVVSFLWFLLDITPGRPLVSIASTVWSFAYVGVLGAYGGLLLASDDGIGLLLGAVLCTIAYDVVGYFVGSQFGRSRIAPRISPNKTVEGTLAGMLASAVIGLIVVGRIHPWNGGEGLLLGVLVAVGAFVGDLAESMVKRDLGIKDFGTLLPGHGGVLDRFDGLLIALPITFYLAIQLENLH